MKRYALFSGADYYAKGGFKDFKRWGDDPLELKKYAKSQENDEEGFYDYQWWHVVDMLNSEILFTVE